MAGQSDSQEVIIRRLTANANWKKILMKLPGFDRGLAEVDPEKKVRISYGNEYVEFTPRTVSTAILETIIETLMVKDEIETQARSSE